MANAVARTSAITADGASMTFYFDVIFTGSDTPDGQPLGAEVQFGSAGSDTLNVLKGKLTTAITVKAVELGFTCVGANMIIPSFQKG